MKHQPISSFLCGALIGAAAALLLAPQKGKTTRKQIKNMIRDEQDKLMDIVDNIKYKIEGKAKNVEKNAEQLMEEAKAELEERGF